jgi:hypothetical protein
MHPYPNFLIVGTMKSGTTTLYDQMCRHPLIVSAKMKEIHFFTPEFVHGEPSWLFEHEYSELLNYDPLLETKLFGEASPSYIAVPQRIFSFNPNCKIIILVRDPTERCISQYWQYVEYGAETKPIDVALSISDGPYVWDSVYHPKIQKFLEIFPAENVLVIAFERYIVDQQSGINAVFSYLNIESVEADITIRGAQTKKLAADDAIRPHLNQLFDKERGKLFEVITKYGCKTYPDVSYFARY